MESCGDMVLWGGLDDYSYGIYLSYKSLNPESTHFSVILSVISQISLVTVNWATHTLSNCSLTCEYSFLSKIPLIGVSASSTRNSKWYEIKLLPFHDVAGGKFAKLGEHYESGSMTAPDEVDLARIIDQFAARGLVAST